MASLIRVVVGRCAVKPRGHIRSVRSRGFTLLELLIAVALLSLIFLLLTSGLEFGTRAWKGGQERPSSTSEMVSVQYLLRRVLSEALPLMIEGTPSAPRHVFFVGNQTSVRFIAPLPEHLGVGGLYEVALYLTEGSESDNRLEMSWRLYRGDGAAPVEARQVDLLDRVAQIQFAYFGDRGPQEPAQWKNDWQGFQTLPELVGMHLTFSSGEVWPDFVVATNVRSLNLIVDDQAPNF
jgi:general secretion pathway protein J